MARVAIGPTLDRFLAVVVVVEPPVMAGGGEVPGSLPRFQLPAKQGFCWAMACLWSSRE
jgi:hypothetical protein